MRVKNLLLVAGTAFVALGAIKMPSVHAAPIPITNPSFEQPSLPKGSFTIENITGWSVINTGNPGVFNPSSTSFQSVPDGNQTLYSNSATVFQQLPATLAPNTTYTLRLQVGRRLDFTNFPGFTVELRAGNTVLASANQTMVPLPEPGKFVPLTLSYTTPSSVPQGQNLEIRLKSAGPQTNFDNVTLDAVSTNSVQDRVDSYMRQAGLPTSAELGEERWVEGACRLRVEKGWPGGSRRDECFYQHAIPGWQIIGSEIKVLENRNGRGSYSTKIIAKNGQVTINQQEIGNKWNVAIDLALKAGDIQAKNKLELERQKHQQYIATYAANENTFLLEATARAGAVQRSVIELDARVKIIRLW
jgi:hypothetical protein